MVHWDFLKSFNGQSTPEIDTVSQGLNKVSLPLQMLVSQLRIILSITVIMNNFSILFGNISVLRSISPSTSHSHGPLALLFMAVFLHNSICIYVCLVRRTHYICLTSPWKLMSDDRLLKALKYKEYFSFHNDCFCILGQQKQPYKHVYPVSL